MSEFLALACIGGFAGFWFFMGVIFMTIRSYRITLTPKGEAARREPVTPYATPPRNAQR